MGPIIAFCFIKIMVLPELVLRFSIYQKQNRSLTLIFTHILLTQCINFLKPTFSVSGDHKTNIPL